MPFPTRFDSQGKIMRGQFSSEFLAWTKTHNVPAEVASREAFRLPLDLLFLASTGDPRGLPLLRKGLSSPNYLVQAVSAKGLALLQDKESIPLIIRSCEKAPSDVRVGIAEPLVFFRDPDAQTAAERFIPDRRMLEVFRALNREKGPDGLF